MSALQRSLQNGARRLLMLLCEDCWRHLRLLASRRAECSSGTNPPEAEPKGHVA